MPQIHQIDLSQEIRSFDRIHRYTCHRYTVFVYAFIPDNRQSKKYLIMSNYCKHKIRTVANKYIFVWKKAVTKNMKKIGEKINVFAKNA